MSKLHSIDIKWEDDAVEAAPAPKELEEEDFAALLAQDRSASRRRYSAGEQITGTVVHVSPSGEDVLVDLGGHVTGVLDRASALDESGELTLKNGDEIKAYVVSISESEVRLSLGLSGSQQSGQDLFLAYRNKLPVKGKVEKENKGGFDVLILGRKAFCPVSQMDLRFVEAKAQYVGKEFDFIIEKFEEGGRNLVVSRSALLKLAAEEKLQEVLDLVTNQNDVELEGIVTDTRDYGAFVDIGGIEGFVHVSEMSHIRVTRAKDFAARGDKVRVKVLKVESVDGKRRISLSMKAAAADPWLTLAAELKIGDSTTATITRLEDFGAFASLPQGVEGLIHISEMAWGKKVRHPSDVVKVGDRVSVRIADVNSTTKRIGLSLKNKEEDPWLDIVARLPVGSKTTAKVESLKGFGAIVTLPNGLTGMLPISTIKKAWGESYRKHCSPPHDIEVTIVTVDEAQRKILLGLPDVAEADSDGEDFKQYLAELSQKQAEKPLATKGMGSFGALLAKKLGQK